MHFSNDQIIEAAKAYVEETYGDCAYPIIPVDEWGNEESYEVGCVPWVSCQDITVKDCSLEADEETIYAIVTVDWAWSREDEDELEEETDVQLSLLVEEADGELIFDTPERID